VILGNSDEEFEREDAYLRAVCALRVDGVLLAPSGHRSRESLGLMNQNLALIAAPNALGMGSALAGAMNPAVAAFLSNGSTVVAAANGLRPLLRRRDRPRARS